MLLLSQKKTVTISVGRLRWESLGPPTVLRGNHSTLAFHLSGNQRDFERNKEHNPVSSSKDRKWVLTNTGRSGKRESLLLVGEDRGLEPASPHPGSSHIRLFHEWLLSSRVHSALFVTPLAELNSSYLPRHGGLHPSVLLHIFSCLGPAVPSVLQVHLVWWG